jgi:hypothetical protein
MREEVMRVGIQELIEWVYSKTVGTVDLRYNDGKWSVLIANGNTMRVVHGSVKDDPISSLEAARETLENCGFQVPIFG